MNCQCGVTALYRVGNRGFCKTHIPLAREAVHRSKMRKEARASGFEELNRQFDAVMNEAEKKRQLHNNRIAGKRRK